jgi:hypothetical protein
VTEIQDLSLQYIALLEARQRLLDLFGQGSLLAAELSSEGAREHLRHGLDRRIEMLLRSTDQIWQILPSERTQPLEDDEAIDLNVHLNSIYVHIRGAIDNLSWALAIEHEVLGPPREDEPDYYRRVGLLAKQFRQAIATRFPKLDGSISPHCQQLEQLPQLRDPVAHRIPLYIIPSFLTPAESKRYRDLGEELNSAFAKRDYAEAGAKLDEMSSLGTFRPFFAHSLRDPIEQFPLHERLASDLGALAAIVASVLQFLREHAIS